MATRMQQRRGTAAEWTSVNPVLGAGEIGFETDTGKFKIGNGSVDWDTLPYFSNADDVIALLTDDAPELLDTLNEIAAAINDDPDFFNTISNSLQNLQLGSLANVDLSGVAGGDFLRFDSDNSEWIPATGTPSSPQVIFSETKPSTSNRDFWGEDLHLAEGDLWYNTTNGIMYIFSDSYDSLTGTWVEVGGSDEIVAGAQQLHAFPALPDDGDEHFGYVYDGTADVWNISRDKFLNDMQDVDVESTSPIDDNVLMYDEDSETWVPSPGIKLDAQNKIPLTFMSLLEDQSNSTYAPKASPVFSGTVELPSTTSIGSVTDTEIGRLSGVDSNIQDQIDTKAPIVNPTFTGTVSGVTASMVGLGNVDNTSDANKPISTATQTALDGKLSLSGGTMTGKITLDSDPTQALHAVTKQYVDSVEAGLISRPQVKAATTANLDATYANGTSGAGATLTANSNGAFPLIDGVQLSTANGDRGLLVKNQTNAAENGRYNLTTLGDENTPWVLTRCGLCDQANEIPGSYIFVTDGTINGKTGWVQHVDDPATFTVGTDDIDVYQFSGAGTVVAGTNISTNGYEVSVIDAPVFAGTVDASAAGVEFSDGTQTKAGVPSLTSFTEKTASYTLDTLDHQDNIVEMNMSEAGTFTIPTNEALAWPVGASMDIFQTGAGEVTIAGASGVTVNATPGLTLRTQWSSATILKRGTNSWVVYGDLKAAE